MFGATFNMLTLITWTTVLKKLKDVCLQINSLASSDCFSCRNVLQNGVDALSKMVKKFVVAVVVVVVVIVVVFSQGAQILCSSDHTVLFIFHQFKDIIAVCFILIGSAM